MSINPIRISRSAEKQRNGRRNKDRKTHLCISKSVAQVEKKHVRSFTNDQDKLEGKNWIVQIV